MSILDKPEGKCRRCGTRSATTWWTSEGMMAAIHGMYEARCEACCVEEQLRYAREAAARIPELEKRLVELQKETA